MDPSTTAFVKGVIAFVLVAGTGMSGFWLWLRERRRTLPGADQAELPQLKQQMEQFAAALEDTQAAVVDQSRQLTELQERADFAERLLAQARDRPKIPHP